MAKESTQPADNEQNPAAVQPEERAAPRTLLRLRTGTESEPRARRSAADQIISQSPAMIELIDVAKRFAASSATVLITGESGTGKELFARLIHESSPRAPQRYGRVNCAALSETLMESELFGHERGAFTGALERRQGRFEWAAHGSLLLDEISEIPLGLQAKLLRVLEEGEYQRVGGNETFHCDVRIIATSNRDLFEQVTEKKFRSDLYYRLDVLRLHLLPLRQRPKDIPLLANFFLQMFRGENSDGLNQISAAAMRALCAYHWPGNVRQLRNLIHRACIVARGETIEPHHLPAWEPETKTIPDWILAMSLEELERHMVLQNLQKLDGHRSAVAARLGVTTRTLLNKLNQYREQGVAITDSLARAG